MDKHKKAQEEKRLNDRIAREEKRQEKESRQGNRSAGDRDGKKKDESTSSKRKKEQATEQKGKVAKNVSLHQNDPNRNKKRGKTPTTSWPSDIESDDSSDGTMDAEEEIGGNDETEVRPAPDNKTVSPQEPDMIPDDRKKYIGTTIDETITFEQRGIYHTLVQVSVWSWRKGTVTCCVRQNASLKQLCFPGHGFGQEKAGINSRGILE